MENSKCEQPDKSVSLENVEEVFGYSINELYKIAIKFYKEKEKNGELKLDYNTRLQFMAYFKQAKYGSFKEEIADCGWFDLVGNDSRKEWKKLSILKTEEAMLEFVRLLDIVCPTTFKAHLKNIQELEAPKIVLAESQVNKLDNIINGSAIESEELSLRYQQQRQQIQEALNKQTYHQFLAYAQQTYPGEQSMQNNLIKQLQEQHYEQYMSQVYAQHSQAQAASLFGNSLSLSPTAQQANVLKSASSLNCSNKTTDDSETCSKLTNSYLQQSLEQPLSNCSKQKIKFVNESDENKKKIKDNTSDVSDEESSELVDTSANPKIAPATLCNSKNIVEFKKTIRKEEPEGILKIGHGEAITVRVPTHEDGLCLYWEFATDYYDLGFGVYFEWSIAETNDVTVHVSESSDEDYDEEENIPSTGSLNDVESANSNNSFSGSRYRRKNDSNRPPMDEIIPIYRRDCHEKSRLSRSWSLSA